MKILHVIDTLDGHGSARQVRLLVPALVQAGCTIEVCCIGPVSAHADELRQAGVTVHALGWTRWLDMAALWTLRRLIRGGGFDLVHVWRLAPLRAVALVARA